MAILRLCLLLIFSCCLGSNIAHAQKAKFKNQRASVQKTRLPQNYIEPEKRTYDLYKTGAYSDNIEPREKGIYGWSVDRESPNLEAAISVYGFRIGRANRSAEKKSRKNKEGEVVERWTEYTYSGTAQGKGTLYIYGATNPFKYEKKNAEKTKAELRKEAEEAEKKKALESNSFLSEDDVAEVEDEGESDISEDAGLENAKLPLAKTISLDIDQTVSSKAHRSSSAAYEDYAKNQKPKLYDFRTEYPGRAYRKAINSLNYQYGYSPVKYNVYLKKMKTEKHPEFKKWNEACQAVDVLFKQFKYNKSIEAKQAKFDPIVAYFAGFVDKIDDKDKKQKKLKKAAFNNLVNTLYYLDRHEAVITLCKKHKDSKLLDKMSKRKLNASDKQIALMAFHKVKSCHLENMTAEVDESDIESEDTGGADDGDGAK